MPPPTPTDLTALGARALPTTALVRSLLPRADDRCVARVVEALALHGPARTAALLDLHGGPRVMAAVELGRRAWLQPPCGTQVADPADVVALATPRLVDDTRIHAIALDVRSRVARCVAVDDEPAAWLQQVLMVGCRRVVLVRRLLGPSTPRYDEGVRARAWQDAAAIVGVAVVDVVWCGDDGYCSALRAGLVRAVDGRYR
jgi:hypothetical protein